ncbi:MAG: DUF5658 family protein [Promethearchaeota archaeon]|jgi:hypothetical protein
MFKNISNKVLLWINILLKFLDVGLTTYIVVIWGITAESNPLIRNAIENYGLILTMIAITIAHVGLIYYLYRRNRRKLLFIAATLMTILVIMNAFATVIQ